MSIAQQDHKPVALHQTRYAREKCKIGVVHIGYGAFHRAHQAVYLDDYMEETGDLNWGIAAVNLRAEDAIGFGRARQITDGYLVKTIDVDGTDYFRMVRSHQCFRDWSSEPEDAEQLVASRDVHLISITVTESGYYMDGEGKLDLADPIIASELNGTEHRTVYAYLSRALSRRKEAVNLPITVLCCDNIRANGKMLQRNLVAYLEASQQNALAQWVKRNVSFPCSMVDRITPHSTSDLVVEANNLFGSAVLEPVHAEAFSQWVLEEKFAGPAPALASAGVEVVPDVHPYEEAKIRILNGGHTALAYLGALAGYKTFDEAMRDPKLRKHFDAFELEEVLPGLRLELPFDKHEYLRKVSNRFCNRAIADQLERICMDGYSKVQLYLRPTLASCLEQGIEPRHTFDCIASWFVYARRAKSGHTHVPYNEPYWDQLSPLLDEGNEMEFATNAVLWGELPEAYSGFAPALVYAIQEMENSWPV